MVASAVDDCMDVAAVNWLLSAMLHSAPFSHEHGRLLSAMSWLLSAMWPCAGFFGQCVGFFQPDSFFMCMLAKVWLRDAKGQWEGLAEISQFTPEVS